MSAGAPLPVPVKRLAHAADLPLPHYQSALAAGLDLLAAVPEDAPVELAPGARALIPTGLVLALPPGYEGQVRPRSGLALRDGVTVLNAPGTVDADYRGELQVILVNFGSAPFIVRRGMRIAQFIIAPVTRAALFESQDVEATERAAGGFGSTGISAEQSRSSDKRSRKSD